MRISIHSGSTVATVEYPQLNCSGYLLLESANKGSLIAQERIVLGDRCTKSGTMRLKVDTDGGMAITYTPDSATYTAFGKLTRA